MDARTRARWMTAKQLDTEKLLCELRDLENQLAPAGAEDAAATARAAARAAAAEADPGAALRAAAKLGDAAEVARLLARGGLDPNGVDEAGATALHYAAARNHTVVMDALGDAGAEVDYTANAFGRTCLMTAALTGSADAVDWLLLHGAAWREEDSEGKTALDWAKEHGQAAAAESLEVWTLTQGSGTDRAAIQQQRWDEEARQRRRLATSYLAAAARGEADEVARLLAAEHGHGVDIDPNCVDDEAGGATAMHLAAQHNAVDLMEVLLRAKARVDATDRYGWTPLIVAAHRGCTEAAEWLLQHGADWRKTASGGSGGGGDSRAGVEGQTALDRATVSRKVGATRLLEDWILAHGSAEERAPFERKRRDEAAAAAKQRLEEDKRRLKQLTDELLSAAKQGQLEELSRLLTEEGLDANSADERQITALAWAGWFNQVGAMEILHAAGADVERADSDAYTALMGAASNGSVEAMEWLLQEGGADWEREDDYGRTALQQAKKGAATKLLERWAAEATAGGAKVQEARAEAST